MPEQLQKAFAATHATFNQKIPFILTAFSRNKKKMQISSISASLRHFDCSAIHPIRQIVSHSHDRHVKFSVKHRIESDKGLVGCVCSQSAVSVAAVAERNTLMLHIFFSSVFVCICFCVCFICMHSDLLLSSSKIV